jgi:DNA-binding XRE family transcriptional regulator
MLWLFQFNRKLRIDMVVRVSKPASPSTAQPAMPEDDPQSAIRAALRRRRRTLGLTQEQAAVLLGLPRLTYHRIEAGRRRIRVGELAAICAVYNCPIGELIADEALAQAFARVAAGA